MSGICDSWSRAQRTAASTWIIVIPSRYLLRADETMRFRTRGLAVVAARFLRRERPARAGKRQHFMDGPALEPGVDEPRVERVAGARRVDRIHRVRRRAPVPALRRRERALLAGLDDRQQHALRQLLRGARRTGDPGQRLGLDLVDQEHVEPRVDLLEIPP